MMNNYAITDTQAAALVEAADRLRCEEDFYYFARSAWSKIEPTAFADGWAFQTVCEHLEEVYYGRIKRLLINIPPRFGKSTIASVLFPIWCWLKKPSEQLMCVSYVEALAMRDHVKARRLLNTPWFQARWGDRITVAPDQNTKQRIDNLQGGYKLVAGVDGAVMGEGANCLVGDALVSTPSGDRKIKDILVGDEVFGLDTNRGKVLRKTVLATKESTANELYEIHTNAGNSVKCTGEHLFYVEGKGYTAAERLVIGDRLCNLGGKRRNNILPDLCVLRKRTQKKHTRHEKSVFPGIARLVLFQKMLLDSPLVQKFPSMFCVRWGEMSQRLEILFSRMFSEYEKYFQKGNSQNLRVWNPLCWAKRKKYVLFQGMLVQSALGTDDGAKKFKFQENSLGIFSDVLQNARNYIGKGLQFLLAMLRTCSGDKEREDKFAHSPYRYGQRKQRSRKLSYALHKLSYALTQDDTCRVVEITKYACEKNKVYDIQVEGTNNFFANGILVHNCIILDDLNNTREVTEGSLAKALEFFTGVVQTRFNDYATGRMVVIQQRVDERDVSGYILANQRQDYVKLILAMEFESERRCVTVPLKSTGGLPWQDPRTEEGELLNEKRINERDLAMLKRALGSEYAVAGQLQQRPAPATGGIIKRHWFKPWKSAYIPRTSFIIQSWDTAISAKDDAAYSAATTWGIFEDENNETAIILLHVWRKKLAFPDLYETMQRMARDYRATTKDREINSLFKPDMVLVEAKASGLSLIQMLNRGGINVTAWNPDKYGGKIERVRRITHILDSGKVYVPYQAPNFVVPKRDAEMFINQAASFPKAESRDLIDTMTAAIQRIINSGWVLHPIEKRAVEDEDAEYYSVPNNEEGIYTL